MKKTSSMIDTCNGLFDRFAEGDTDALAEFIELVRSSIVRKLSIKGHQEANINDAIQDAAAEMLSRPTRWISGGATAYSYFFTAVRCSLYKKSWRNILQNHKVIHFSRLESHADGPSFDVADYRGPVSGKHAGTVTSYTHKKAVRRAVSKLTAKQREIVRLRFECGMTTAEVARHLGVRPFAVDGRFKFVSMALRKDPVICSILGVDPPPKRVVTRGQNVPKGELTEKQWDAVRLHHGQGKSYRESARALGTTSYSVMGNWKAALKKIAKSKELQTLTGIRPGMYGI